MNQNNSKDMREKLLVALDLYWSGVLMMKKKIEREHPEMSKAKQAELLHAWIIKER